MKEYKEREGKPCFIDDGIAGGWELAYQRSRSRDGFKNLLVRVYKAVKAPRIKTRRRFDHTMLLRELTESGGDYKALYIGYSQPFEPSIRSHVIELEVVPKEHVDVIAFGEGLPFPDGCFDLVVASGVIEHTTNPFSVVAEAFRVLKNNGKLYISTPWVYPFHGGDNYRFSHEALHLLCAQFKHVEVGSLDGPLHALGIFLHYFICEVLSFGNRYLRYALSAILSWIVLPLMIADAVFNKPKRGAYVLDANLYAVARK